MNSPLDAPRLRSWPPSPRGDEQFLVEWDGGPLLVRRGPSVTRDVQLWSAIESPAVARPIAWGSDDDGAAWIARPWIEGRTFDEAAADAPVADVVAWVDALLEGLAALHEAGWVHRDVKAGNVVVGDDGGVTLIDLELTTDRPTRGGAGTPGHLAPELLLGQDATPATDLFAVGAMVAFALCGGSPAAVAEHFPRRDFWDSSGADASRLPGELAPLVRACVRRRPHDRPASANEARRLLPGADRPLPDLAVPFATGRREWLAEWTRATSAGDGLAVLAVDDALEVPAVARAVHASLIAHGRRVAPLDVDGVLAPRGDGDLHGLVLTAVPDDTPPGTLRLVARALAASPVAVLVAPTAALDEAGVTDARRRWPPVDAAALAGVLDVVTGHAHSDAATALARDLHARTGGAWRRIDAAVARAEKQGVLVRGHRAWDVHLDRWPDDVDEQLADAPPADVAPLAVLALWLDHVPSPGLASEWLDVTEDDAARRLAALRRHAAGRSVADVGRAAERSLDHDVRADLAGRCVERLRERGESSAADELAARAAALDDATAEALLDRADAARLAGRLSSARRVASAVGARAGDGSLVARAAALVARLDMAQGSARLALDALQAAWSPLERAPTPVRVVASLAGQQVGDRELVAALAASLDANDDDDARGWAHLSRAYALFLAGDPAGALEVLDAPDDALPDECRIACLNLRGVALARVEGRHGDARTALLAARDAARELGDVAGEARALLNLADLHRRMGEVRDEHARLLEASDGFARAGHVAARAVALNNLGVLQRDLGDTLQARALLDQSLTLRRRAADRPGEVVSSISRMLATLDACALSEAIDQGTRCVELAESTGAPHHARFARARVAWALALAGRTDEARAALDDAETDTAAEAIGRALVAFADERTDEARTWSVRALERARSEGRRAETARAAALVLTWTPDHEGARTALREAGELSDVRAAEAAWREGRRDADVGELAEWAGTFERAGRVDLVRAVQLELATHHEARGDVHRRRTALAAAAECTDALVDGLRDAERGPTLERLAVLAGARPRMPRDGALDLAWFVSCNRRMATESDLDGLLLSIVDMALGATGAQRGLLVLLDDDDDAIAVHAARGLDGDATAEHISRTVVLRAVEQGAPLVTTDALSDDRFAASTSIPRFHLRSVLCVPLPASDELRGALYVDDADTTDMFDDADVRVLAALADQAALAITQLRRRERIEQLSESLSRKVAAQEDELVRSRRMLRRSGRPAPVAGIVGESDAMQRVFHLVERLAPTDLAVLVTGPSGVGKDLVARALHSRSPRADQALIVENVAAIPASLLETEFFGHARGAFTGADRARSGLFKEADGGTFVLDEIGEMPLELQAKLLRVLESGEYRPIGSRTTETTDARIVACTNRDLRERVADGAFREDLLYRLDVAEIRVPSLAERIDDVPLLAAHALARLNAKHGTDKRMTDEVVAALVARDWPGQVRELFNEVSRLYYLCGDVVDDPSWIRTAAPTSSAASDTLDLAQLERATIERALDVADGNKERAAGLLGISRAGLYAKLKRFAEQDGDAGD